eukprot:gene11642-biopygen2344
MLGIWPNDTTSPAVTQGETCTGVSGCPKLDPPAAACPQLRPRAGVGDTNARLLKSQDERITGFCLFEGSWRSFNGTGQIVEGV